jgi:biopolymer transport protein ExbB
MAQTTTTPTSTATKPVTSTPKKQGSSNGELFAPIAIVSLLVFSFLIWKFYMGQPQFFEGGDPEKGHPIDGNFFGTVYKGGFIVPVLISFLLIVVVMSVERFITISRANGKGSVPQFVRKIQAYLSSNDVNGAMKECDRQQGSVGNVVSSVLHKYQQMMNEPNIGRDQKVVAIQKELEEATALELPMLERNLVVIATLASIATLGGLLGTVLGMIKAFSALANAGAPDAAALSTGISEALINTAFGIGTSAVAIVMYNYFTSRIDGLTHAIDEAGFSIVQNFQSKVPA